jgi:tRNA pseudouridine13 synthase
MITSSLTSGRLQGNRFTVTLRRCAAGRAQLEAGLAALRADGFLNYFGLQRFGTGGTPTHAVGRALLQGRWEAAAKLILGPTGIPAHRERFPYLAQARAHFARTFDAAAALGMVPHMGPGSFPPAEAGLLLALRRAPQDAAGALDAMPRNLRLLYVHAYQSMVWNKAATARAELGTAGVLAGDLVRVGGAQAVGGQTRVRANESAEESEVHVVTAAEAAAGAYGLADVVLPLPGFAVRYPENASGEVYRALLAADGVDLADKKRQGDKLPGDYRPLVQRCADLEWSIMYYTEDDEQLGWSDYDRVTNPNGWAGHSTQPLAAAPSAAAPSAAAPHCAVQLSFSLPRSTYATMLLRELTKQDSSAQANRAKTEAMQAEVRRGNLGEPYRTLR